MYLIPCDSDCVYQKEGYCLLKSPSIITNQTDKGCVHYIKKFNNKHVNITQHTSNNANSSFQTPV